MKTFTTTYTSPLGSIVIETDGQAITSLQFSNEQVHADSTTQEKDGEEGGETLSYGEIAKMVGCRSAQAVGQAVGANPIALIIPCHRVIAAHGKIGGYAYGTEIKKRLLDLEQL